MQVLTAPLDLPSHRVAGECMPNVQLVCMCAVSPPLLCVLTVLPSVSFRAPAPFRPYQPLCSRSRRHDRCAAELALKTRAFVA